MRKLASREIGVSELLADHISLVERFDPRVNALVVPLLEDAVAAARSADRKWSRDALPPLYGMPVTVKECFDVAGVPTTIGVPALAAQLATKDSPLVQRLRESGAILIGKTNLPQLMWFNECDNPVFGRTNNPWDLGRSPGGSSGGEAAIVALGASRLGFGTDSGGSVRVPAHFCGVHTLKPTDGRLTLRGTADARLLAGQEGIVDQPGPFARHVEDLALAMAVLAPFQHAADSRIPPVPWPDPSRVSIRGLRVGVFPGGPPMAPARSVRRVVEEAADALAGLGAELDEFAPPEPEYAKRFYDRIFSADGGTGLERVLADGPRDWRIEKMLAPMQASGPLSIEEYFSIVADRTRYREDFVELLTKRGLDAILCPPFPLPSLPHESSADPELQLAEISCAVFNIVGMPAGVVAASTIGEAEEAPDDRSGVVATVLAGSTGLPVGVQVAARHWRDDIVLALMQALETHFRSRSDYPGVPRVISDALAHDANPRSI